jgi:tryptophan synthase alpha chain
MVALEDRLRLRRAEGRKLLVPYVTGGITPEWTDYVRAYAEAGADAVEIGLPFSDPMLDGPTIQEASDAALARGASVRGILADVATLRVDVPLVASTYCNLVVHHGPQPFCAALRDAGLHGLIVPDLPLEEVGEVEAAAADAEIALALLASPATPQDRLPEIAERSRGFVYAVSLMGTTGERATLGEAATRLAVRLKRRTDRPVLLGFGISTPEQAVRATRGDDPNGAGGADGIVVGAALMRRVLDGAGPKDAGSDLAAMRRALDREA